jgi:hypothetical protein
MSSDIVPVLEALDSAITNIDTHRIGATLLIAILAIVAYLKKKPK